MNSAQQSVNEQIQQFSHMQSRAFQPMRIFGGWAAGAMEQVVRKNYAVMGDFLEFSVKQSQLPLSSDNAGDIFSAQMEQLSTFGGQMNSRASEYVDLVSTLSKQVRKATDDAAAQVRDVADDAAEQAKRVVEEAVVYTQKATDATVVRAVQGTDEVSDTVKKAADEAGDNAKRVTENAEKAAGNAKSAVAGDSNRAKKTATSVNKSA